jgi:hypothetical protein
VRSRGEGVWRGKEMRRRSVRQPGRGGVSEGKILYVSIGVGRKKPNVGTVVWKVSHAGKEGDGSRCTPCNMIETRSKSDGNTVRV